MEGSGDGGEVRDSLYYHKKACLLFLESFGNGDRTIVQSLFSSIDYFLRAIEI